MQWRRHAGRNQRVAIWWALSAAGLIAWGGSVAAAEPGYTHLEVGFQHARILPEDSSTRNPRSIGLAGSAEVGEHAFLIAEATHVDDADVRINTFAFGVGGKWRLLDGLDLYGSAAYRVGNEGVPELALGFRARPDHRLEIDLRFGVDPIETKWGGQGLLAMELGVRVYVTRALAVGFNYYKTVAGYDRGSAQRISLRYDFGG